MRILACVILALGAVTLYAVRMHGMNGRLLRADPDLLSGDSAAYQYGVMRGKSVFGERCATCHGRQGQGDAPAGVPSLADQDWLYGTGLTSDIERTIAFGIRSHHPRAWNLAIMPAYARPNPGGVGKGLRPLSPGEISDIVEFLFLLEGRTADGDAAARGAALFKNQGACDDCHGPDAKGDNAIGAPNLTDRLTLYGDGSRRSLFVTIAYGRQGVCPSWARRLSPLDIRETALYVHSLSHGKSAPHADP
jgi:cytochrome c oxidase cbb3-type subunit 3